MSTFRVKHPQQLNSYLVGNFAVLIFLSIAPTSIAVTFYVDKDNDGGLEDGASWATAFSTIQPAIDAAFEAGGGEVWVAEGVYDEQRTFLRNEPPINVGSLQMKEGVDLFGGFSGVEIAQEDRNPMKFVTVIDGSIARDGEPAIRTIVATDGMRISGFTIRGGSTGSDNIQEAGGVEIRNASATIDQCKFVENDGGFGAAIITSSDVGVPIPTIEIRDCRFEGNRAKERGGAISHGRGQMTVERCHFYSNSVTEGRGGAVSGDLDIVACVFENNSAPNGGAVSGEGSISRSVFRGNVATNDGGAIITSSLDRGSLRVENCLFYDNVAGRDGGAIFAMGQREYESGLFTLTLGVRNSTFSRNTSGGASGVIGRDLANVIIDNSILWNNGPLPAIEGTGTPFDISFTIIEGGCNEADDCVGENNIDLDPLFFDPERNLFQLTENSPAIDSGTPERAPDVDIDGNPRPFGDGFDMGAYEFDGTLPPVHVTLTTAVEGEGTISPEAGDSFHPVGTAIEFEATAAEGSGFSHWEGDLAGSTNPTEITLEADTSVTAVIKEQFTLETSVQGMGSIAPPAGSSVFLDGAVVNVLAMPADGWGFSHWEGDLAGSSSPMQITVDADKTVTAVFREEVTLTTEVQGMGTVEPSQGTFLDGDEVTLEASGAAGWMFDRWQGTLEGSPNPVTVVIDTDLHAAAVFTRIPNDCPTMPATTTTPPASTLMLYGAVFTAVAALGRRTRRT